MIFKRLLSGDFVADEEFDRMYTCWLKQVSKTHFTPVDVAKVAVDFLVTKPGTRVLDVGSGAGKFCMIGAVCTKGLFTGIEQRKYLCQYASLLSRYHKLDNVRFIHANIMQVNFRQFDAVYFYNAFYENIFQNNAIDTTVTLDKTLYNLYSQYMKEQLVAMPVGTRLATYFSFTDEIPEGFEILSTAFDKKLKLWEKVE